jgi:hypothetical protein
VLMVGDRDFACRQTQSRECGKENNRHEMTPVRAVRAVEGQMVGISATVEFAAPETGRDNFSRRVTSAPSNNLPNVPGQDPHLFKDHKSVACSAGRRVGTAHGNACARLSAKR